MKKMFIKKFCINVFQSFQFYLYIQVLLGQSQFDHEILVCTVNKNIIKIH